MADVLKRNAAVKAALKAYSDHIRSDPARLAKWVDDQRKWSEDFNAYMALERHEGNCHCSRCMSEFSSKTERNG